MGKYKEIEYTQYEEEAIKALQELEVAIMTHLEELKKTGNYTFDELLASYQVLVQVRQTWLLQGIFDQLRLLNMNGFPVYPMAT